MSEPLVHRVEDLAVDIKLKLLRRGVTEADGARPFVSRQPGKLHLGEPSLAGESVHDLDLRRLAGHRAEQPLPPGSGLFNVAGMNMP